MTFIKDTDMRSLKKIALLSLFLISFNSIGTGRITSVSFSGPDDPNHAHIVQFEIEGGFSGEYNAQSCNATFAAIRNTADRQHLISYLLTAYTTKEKIGLVLNPSDKYYDDRCTVARAFSVK
jgi:hypothetical protein